MTSKGTLKQIAHNLVVHFYLLDDSLKLCQREKETAALKASEVNLRVDKGSWFYWFQLFSSLRYMIANIYCEHRKIFEFVILCS